MYFYHQKNISLLKDINWWRDAKNWSIKKEMTMLFYRRMEPHQGKTLRFEKSRGKYPTKGLITISFKFYLEAVLIRSENSAFI